MEGAPGDRAAAMTPAPSAVPEPTRAGELHNQTEVVLEAGDGWY